LSRKVRITIVAIQSDYTVRSNSHLLILSIMIVWKTKVEKDLVSQALRQNHKRYYMNKSTLASTDNIILGLCIM